MKDANISFLKLMEKNKELQEKYDGARVSETMKEICEEMSRELIESQELFDDEGKSFARLVPNSVASLAGLALKTLYESIDWDTVKEV